MDIRSGQFFRMLAICLLATLAVPVPRVCAQTVKLDSNLRKWLECDVSWISTDETVGPDFSVKLSFRKTPIAGAWLMLAPTGDNENTSEVRAVTDSSGTARFYSVPPGKYWPSVEGGLLFPSIELTVIKQHKDNEEFSISWPIETHPVRALRGRLVSPDELTDSGVPLRHTSVELLNLWTGRVIERGLTDEGGYFQFSTNDPGVYVFRVTPAPEPNLHQSSRNLPIELDPSAKDASIPAMKVVQSECAGVELFRETKPGLWQPE